MYTYTYLYIVLALSTMYQSCAIQLLRIWFFFMNGLLLTFVLLSPCAVWILHLKQNILYRKKVIL
jgi:hypothetical protein